MNEHQGEIAHLWKR